MIKSRMDLPCNTSGQLQEWHTLLKYYSFASALRYNATQHFKSTGAMQFFATNIHSLIKASKTGGAIDGTASGYISSPQKMYTMHSRRRSVQMQTNINAREERTKSTCSIILLLWDRQEPNLPCRGWTVLVSLDKISSSYQFVVTDTGRVH